MNITHTSPTVQIRQAKTPVPAKAEQATVESEGTSITIDLSTIGDSVGSGLRVGAGALSLALHAPQVLVGPMFTPPASADLHEANAGDRGYAASNAVGIGLAAGLTSYLLGGSLGNIGLAGAIGGVVGGVLTMAALQTINTADAKSWGQTSVSLEKQKAFENFPGSRAAKKGKALKEGYQEAGRFYYQKGARTMDGIADFLKGMTS